MQTFNQNFIESNFTIAKRALLSTAIGGVFTFFLFVMMYHLTAQEGRVQITQATPVLIDPVFQEPNEKIITRSKIQPQPEPKELPKAIQEIPDKVDEPNGSSLTFSIPINPSIVITAPTIFGSADSELRPIVRVDPKYPVEAARNGIEGWVKMRFDVDALGSVKTVKVIASEPPKMFDKEARRALLKWKYKPRMENGSAISQPNQTVVIEFSLAEQ